MFGVSVIVKVVLYILQITQFADQVKITFITELTSGISGVLEKFFSVLMKLLFLHSHHHHYQYCF